MLLQLTALLLFFAWLLGYFKIVDTKLDFKMLLMLGIIFLLLVAPRLKEFLISNVMSGTMK